MSRKKASALPPLGVPLSPLKLVRHQKSLDQLLLRIDEKRTKDGLKSWGLRQIYLGALCAADDSRNPDRFAHAAHSFRELMEKLPWSIKSATVPSPKGNPPGLKAMVNELREIWKKTKRKSATFKQANLVGAAIDKHVEIFIGQLDGFFEKSTTLLPTKVQQGKSLLQHTDLLPYPLPEKIERIRLEEWKEYDEFFQGIAHHQAVQSEADFNAWVLRFEVFLLDRLSPRAHGTRQTIKDLIKKGESDAQS